MKDLLIVSKTGPFLFVAALFIILISCLKRDDDITIALDRYENNDLELELLINGRSWDTVYIDSSFLVKANVNLFEVDYYELEIDNQVFYENEFYYSLSQEGIYPIWLLASNGGRNFRDTALIYSVPYPRPSIWLPGLWGGDTDSARFRIGIDTLFFNLNFCPTRALPFAVFGDSLIVGDTEVEGVFFSLDSAELLRFYRQDWYYLPIDSLPWLQLPNGKEFLFLNYGGDYYAPEQSLARIENDYSYNERFECFVIASSFIRWRE